MIDMMRFGTLTTVLVMAVWPDLSASAQQGAMANATLVNGFVVGVTVIDGGSGYFQPPQINFLGNCVNTAGAFATLSNGAVSAVTVTNAGYAYTSPPVVVLAPPPPFGEALVLNLPLDGNVADTGPNFMSVVTHGGTFTTNRHGQANSALALNGVNQYLEIPYRAALYPDEMTLSLWVKFPQFSGCAWRAGNATTDGWRGYDVEIMNAQGQFRYTDFNGSTYNANVSAPEGQLAIGEWKHVVLTRSTHAATLFVNGIPLTSQASLTAYAKPQVTAMLIGANYNFTSSPFQFCPMTVDSVHIYNRALSEAEVQSLYQTEAPRDVPTLSISAPESQAIRVKMQVLAGQTYQMESSPDLATWLPEGLPFTTADITQAQDFIVTPGAKFFRLAKQP